MQQENPPLIFSQPLTFYGSQQNFEDEIDEIEDEKDFLRFGLQTHLLFPFQQNIGLFLHWSDLT
ncbi:MAG TPA: hypothetical protein VLE89_06665 [Chlamydiales bacterium]|nr:hypothetical protein [Chlamydiales bacterium]